MEIGFPTAAHEEEIEVDVPDLRGVVTKALEELQWNSAENTDEEFTQVFRPDWWTNHWKVGTVKVLSANRVRIHISKHNLFDMVDWNDGCAKLCAQFRAKLLEVAARAPGHRAS